MVLLERAFRVALWPENLPHRRALSADRSDKLLDVASHILDGPTRSPAHTSRFFVPPCSTGNT